jgi:hypothetical protein
MGAEIPRLHTVVDQDVGAILDIERGQITTLNSHGTFVWQALQRGEEVESIVAKISLDSGEATLTVERDVRRFLESLKESRLLP